MSKQVGIFNTTPVGIHSHLDDGNGGLLPYESLSHFVNKQKSFDLSTSNFSKLILSKNVDIELIYPEGEGEPTEIYRVKTLKNIEEYYFQISLMYRIAGNPPSGSIRLLLYKNDIHISTGPLLSATSYSASGLSHIFNFLSKNDLIKVIVDPYTSTGFAIGMAGLNSDFNMYPAYFLFEQVS